jgi:hypothetical protein
MHGFRDVAADLAVVESRQRQELADGRSSAGFRKKAARLQF